MKFKAMMVALALGATLLTGCGSTEQPETNTNTDANTTTETSEVDVVTTASVVSDEATLENAVSKDGTWIIVFTNDFTYDKDIVVEGEFTNKDKPARKIALYTQDEERNKTASFTLTAPKLVVKSENTVLQGGTFVGDVYVEANGFSVVDAKVEGNVYFVNEDVKATFKTDKGGTVTGATEVQ